MAEARPSVEALLAVARAEFGSRLPAKVDEIASLVSEGAWEGARRAAHKLRGSAATYGFPALSAAAAAIEETLIAAAAPPSADVVVRVKGIVSGACVEAQRAASEHR
jgi:HPt (histidine-containing phosphotransfer) domain-containing protein